MTAIRLSDDLRVAIDRAIADTGVDLTRSAYIRGVLVDHLGAKGYLTKADT